MKSIVCVNTQIPTVENELSYSSDGSLRDYDIVVFEPQLPYQSRINFSAGGSCISIEGASAISKSSAHWSGELVSALRAGKTIFVILSAYKEDSAAIGTVGSSKGSTSYQTSSVNNYSTIPGGINVKNSRGRGIVVKDPAYKALFDTIKDIAEYRVVFEGPAAMRTIFAAKDGTPVGGIIRFKERPGHLVLLPYFDFTAPEFREESDDEIDGEVWSKKALQVSRAVVSQFIAVDRMLKSGSEGSPPPAWVSDCAKPGAIVRLESDIAEIDAKTERLRQQREQAEVQRAEILEFNRLLYETGKPLEHAIEKVLRLLGYAVDTHRIGDLEIDHVIISPTGRRMIGESEGKDTSAIDISKFRQLESNIGEDFERDDVDEPAKGLLFGNGFRLSEPGSRAEQFTQKSLTNARRLGSALIRTADLYPVAVHLLDHPEDDAFREACRVAIEETTGGIVVFPKNSDER